METSYVDDAVELLEKANTDLDPELISIPERKRRLESYARARRLVDFGIAALAGKLDDAEKLAKVTGTSIGKAREAVATGKTMSDSKDLSLAMRGGGHLARTSQRDRSGRSCSSGGRQGAGEGRQEGIVPRAEGRSP